MPATLLRKKNRPLVLMAIGLLLLAGSCLITLNVPLGSWATIAWYCGVVGMGITFVTGGIYAGVRWKVLYTGEIVFVVIASALLVSFSLLAIT